LVEDVEREVDRVGGVLFSRLGMMLGILRIASS
jgi:hypothetical protein